MAGRGLKHSGYRFFTPAPETTTAADDEFEFNESDMWGYGPDSAESWPAELGKPARSNRTGRKKGDRDRGAVAASLPVNIPDWSKILREEYRGSGVEVEAEDDKGEGYGAVIIPPHELLCRNRAASFSVHEGIGRTLKGRDLSRVRNAIWEKTGFQD